MRVAKKRWGEITIKKQGKRKNQFDTTKSFSIERTQYEYDVNQLKEILGMTVNLSEKFTFKELMRELESMEHSK